MSVHPYTRGYFEGDGTGYLGLYRDFVTHWRMIKAIKEKKPSSVLDVAGARGYICKHLEAEMGIRAVCMDISDHCFHTRATDNFVLHDARKAPWPFKDKEFDLAISMAFMEHLTEEEISTVVKEIARVSQRAYLTITFEKTPQDIDVTHRTFRPLEWWVLKFKEYAPDYPVEIMSSEEAKKMEQTPIELPQPDGLVKLNIGSFLDMFHYGWENIDSQDLSQFALQNGYVFKQYDVRRGIQKPDNSTDVILASHIIEHLSRDEGDAFLKECYRVLKPKGILRLVIPDTMLLIGKYVDGSIMEFRHINVGVEKAPDTAEALFHLLIAGHQTMYDLSSLTTKLKKNGNWKIQKMTAFESQSEAIRKQTIPNFPTLSCYIEGKKLEVKQEISLKAKPKLTSDSKLKIALISTPMLTVFPKNYGGLEDQLGNLAEALAEMGHDVTVFAPNGSKVEGCQVVEFGEPLERVNVNWLEAERKAYEFYKGMLKDHQIIHGMNWFGMEYAYKSSNPQAHVVHTHHGGISDYWKRSPPPFKLNMVAISDFMVKVYASQGFTAKRVYNGINLEKYPLKKRKGTRLLFLGRISKIKAPHVAIEVAKKANIGLDVVGATSFVDDPSYVELVKSLCDGEQIKFVGEVSHAVKLNYLQNARSLIVPSTWGEPFGLHVIETMAVGSSVLAFPDGGIAETVKQGGILCSDVESMVNALSDLGRITPAMCRKNAELFSRENMARGYEKIYRNILSGDEW
jgi:glycosyltransferase involved in cell wall biosynthesis/predicted SAM-dependent methyltransferase